MNKDQVDDALDSLRVITNETHMIVIGTQSLHGTHPNLPDDIVFSREIDVILKNKATLANWISDVVGNYTPFEAERGYFIDHVRPKPGLPVLADGWEQRMTREQISGKCIIDYLSPEDLVIAKLGAGREKDFPFVAGMLNRGVVTAEAIAALISVVHTDYQQKVAESFSRALAMAETPCQKFT